MAWIKVDQTIITHKKTLKLASALGIEASQAIGLMVTLWLWAIDNAPDGSLDDIDAPLLSRAIGWSGDPDRLIGSLNSVGLIDGKRLHNWEDHNGKLMDQRQSAKERAKKSRENRAAIFADASQRARTVREPCANVTTQSRVDQSRQDQSRQDTPPEPPEGAESEPVPFSEIQKLYNATCSSFPKIKAIEGPRKKAVAARWKTYPDIGTFSTLFKKTQASTFLKGGNDRNWSATFDWIMKANNMAKVLEGNYDDERRAKHGADQQHPPENDGRQPNLTGFEAATGDEDWGRPE